MAAPTNTTAETATDIPSLPATITQDVHDAGTTYSVWFKYTAVAGDNVIGGWGYGDFSAYRPVTTIESPPGESLHFQQNRSRPFQLAVTPGQTYYFFFHKGTVGNPSPAVLTFTLERFSDQAVPVGAIVANDEKRGFPLVFASGVEDLTTLRFVQGIANGDQGAQPLADGTIALGDDWRTEDPFTGQLIIYDKDFETLATIVTPKRTHMTSNRRDAFYYRKVQASESGGAATVAQINTAGEELATWTITPPTGFMGTFGVSPDETVLYYTITGDTPLKRWDLLTDTALPDLATLPTAPSQNELLVLEDGSVVVLVDNWQVVRYSAAGGLLNTYNFDPESTVWNGNRLAHDHVSDAYFWVRDHRTPTVDRFYRVHAASGAMTYLEHATFLSGVYGESDLETTPDPVARFGVPESCPFWLVQGACVTAPPRVECWDPETPSVGCVNAHDGPKTAGCWNAHSQPSVGLLNTGQP